ncbi:MAG: Rieske 2Fe-2S domain-containing protein [Nitrospirales bacterium]
MLDGFWYIAANSRRVRAGRPTGVTLLNQPIVLLRDQSRVVHALEDRCTHRGVPLSEGWQEGDSIRCRYHGWRYSLSGTCVEIPALGNGDRPKLPCVRSYPVQEQDGWVWIYMGAARRPLPSAPAPRFPVPSPNGRVSTLRMSLSVKARMEFAVDNFIDPAHVPFVHHGLFRQKHVPKVKEKEFTRLAQGFRTVNENVKLPNTIVFRVLNPRLASAVTTVDFLMPGIHVETFEVGSRWGAIMVVVTPVTDTLTRLDFTMGWNFLRWAVPLEWLARLLARKALRQDRAIIELQEQGHTTKAPMRLCLESDTMSLWYRQLKKYHLDQLANLPTTHPIPEKITLKWVT